VAYLSALSAWVFLDGWLIAASHLFCGPNGKTPFFYIHILLVSLDFFYVWQLFLIFYLPNKKTNTWFSMIRTWNNLKSSCIYDRNQIFTYSLCMSCVEHRTMSFCDVNFQYFSFCTILRCYYEYCVQNTFPNMHIVVECEDPLISSHI